MGCFRGGSFSICSWICIYIYVFWGCANGIIIVMGGTGVRNGCCSLRSLGKITMGGKELRVCSRFL